MECCVAHFSMECCVAHFWSWRVLGEWSMPHELHKSALSGAFDGFQWVVCGCLHVVVQRSRQRARKAACERPGPGADGRSILKCSPSVVAPTAATLVHRPKSAGLGAGGGEGTYQASRSLSLCRTVTRCRQLLSDLSRLPTSDCSDSGAVHVRRVA